MRTAMTKSLTAVLALTALTAACGGSDGPAESTAADLPLPYDGPPVIVDYSPTVSDIGALVFLAVHVGDDLIGVTLPGTGESHCAPGVAHTRGVLEALGLGAVPVACGPEEAVGVLRAFPDEWRSAADALDLPEAAPNETRPAPQLLASLVSASPSPVEIVAVGPLTNVALALAQHPEITDGIAGITVMGGAVDVPGNVPADIAGWETANGRAEANFWVDASAAAEVFRSGIPLTLVPLDATNSVPTSSGFAAALSSGPGSEASRFLSRVWDDAPEWTGPGFYLWDELAAVIFAEPSIAVFETRRLIVDDGGDESAGWSRADTAGSPIRVAVSADRDAFQRTFLAVVGGTPPGSSPGSGYFLELETAITAHGAAADLIFEESAAALGLGESSEDDAWLEVIVEAAPRVLDEAFTGLLATVQTLTPPAGITGQHDDYVTALGALVQHRDEFLAALNEAGASGNLDQPLPYLDSIESACRALQDAAVTAGAIVDLHCGG